MFWLRKVGMRSNVLKGKKKRKEHKKMHSSVRKVASFEPVSWHLGEDATRQRSSGSIQSHGIINRLRSYTVKACTLYIKDHTVRIHWILGNFFFRERYLHIINVSPTRKKQTTRSLPKDLIWLH